MSSTHILFPVFAMFVLAAGVLMHMRTLRFAAVRSGKVPLQYYRAFEGQEPEPLRVVARDFINLFEVPVFFYVGVLMTYVTNQVDVWMVGGAWLYVALRYLHTFVHLIRNDVVVRFSVYMASNAVLAIGWGALFVRLLGLTG